MNEVGRFMDADQAAARGRFTSRFLRKLEIAGDGPPVLRIGRRKLYEVEAFDNWLLAHHEPQDAAA